MLNWSVLLVVVAGYASRQLVSGMDIMTISDQGTITVCTTLTRVGPSLIVCDCCIEECSEEGQ